MTPLANSSTPDLPAPFGAPLFFPLAEWLARLPGQPDSAALAALVAEAGLRTESGQPLSLVPPPEDSEGYEARIWRCGQVETRPDNWHDFFNGLVWLAFPRAKAALNARHARAMAEMPGEGRGTVRDAMTHFDECGLVVVSADPSLLQLIRDFQWTELFWQRRAELASAMAFYVFGHATYESLLQPFRGLTAKAVLYEVDAAWLAQSVAQQRADIDRRLAGELAAGRYASPRELQPVPLMGLPGLTPDNERADYYADTWQFRPGRRSRGSV